MKTKSILPVITLYFAAACMSNGATYQVNLAGGVYQVVANNLDNPPNDLSTLLAILPNKSTVSTWDSSTSVFTTASKLGGGWSQNLTINRGEAAIIKSPSAATITFSGTAAATPPMARGITPGSGKCYLLGSQVFDTGNPTRPYTYYEITGDNPPPDGIALYKFPGSFAPGVSACDDSLGYQVFVYRSATGWDPGAPTILKGEGVWIGPSPQSIEGTVFKYNGICPAGGPDVLRHWHIRIVDTATGGVNYTRDKFTDQNGHYVFYVPPGTYTVKQVPDACWIRTCPIGPNNYPGIIVNAGDHLTGRDFGSWPDTLAHPKPDLSVQVYATYPFFSGHQRTKPCCGQDMYYHIFFRNGCLPYTGATLKFEMPSQVTYSGYAATAGVSPPSPGTGNTETWNLPPLAVGDIGRIDVTVNVNAAGCSQIPPGTLLSATATIYPTGSLDAVPANNVRTRNARVTCSFDPNDKEVTPKGCGPSGLINAQPLTYTVHFQNLGSGPAYDVVVRDLLDPSLDSSTLEVLDASHNYAFDLIGQEMVWTFPNINLPAATDDEPGSHGFLTYRVSPLPGLADGTVITNQARVYFDQNSPVLTPTTTNTITTSIMPVASFTATSRQGSAGHTNDFTYTGGTAGATFFWDFGPDAIPPTSTSMNPSGVVFATDGVRIVSLQVALAGCDAEPATYLLSVGQPKLNVALSDNQVCVSWDGDGYSVQETGTLDSPVSWQTIHPPITLLGGTHSTCLGITNTFRYYRLTDQ